MFKLLQINKDKKTIVKLFNENEFELALSECISLIEKYPNNITFYEYKYHLLIQLQQLDEALNCIEKIIEIKPDINNYYRKASLLCHEYVSRYEEALEIYNKLLKKVKRSSELYLSKGIALACLKRNSEADKCYDKAIRLDKHSYWAYINKAVLYLNTEDYQEALRLSDLAYKKNNIKEDIDYLYFTKARIYAKLKNDEECIKYLKMAIEMNQRWKVSSNKCDELKPYMKD